MSAAPGGDEPTPSRLPNAYPPDALKVTDECGHVSSRDPGREETRNTLASDVSVFGAAILASDSPFEGLSLAPAGLLTERSLFGF